MKILYKKKCFKILVSRLWSHQNWFLHNHY